MARILVVDDEEMDRLIVRSTLQRAGHELLFAPDGEVGFRIYETQDIDLVITDLAMPHVDGLRLIQNILAIDSTARIIAATGVSPEKLPVAKEMGAVYTMCKPLDPKELALAVDKAVALPIKDPWW